MTTLHFEKALLPGGWAENVTIGVTDDGFIHSLETDAESAGISFVPGVALPGMANLHSHAFQRALAGLGEVSGTATKSGKPDSFWSWRTVMYDFLAALQPEDISAIALKLYVDMLKAGYTTVAEFHYLHHDTQGNAYSDPAEMSARVIAAALEAGIGITHLPVLYSHGGFAGKPAQPDQRRFLNGLDDFMTIVTALHTEYGAMPGVRIGIAPHSLRAVTPDLLGAAVSALNQLDATAPIHIHIAEQTREVDECLAWSGKRPVEWLLENQSIDQRWCLIHATHMSDEETDALAASKAVAGLCPTTEANLGDGLFPAHRFLEKGGVIGIGSDSHISVNLKEELRWLEYGQRLFTRQRAVLSGGPQKSTARRLYDAALIGGARACGQPIGALEVGKRADLIVLDCSTSPLYGRSDDAILDSWIFGCDTNPVRDVYVAGRHIVQGGHHGLDQIAEKQFQDMLKRRFK